MQMQEKIMSLLEKRNPGNARTGGLRVESSREEDPATALKKFSDFGGEGWLLLARDKEVLILPGDLDRIPRDGWPVRGELAKGNESLHLDRAGPAWRLSVLTERPDEDGILIGREFIRRDNPGRLRYAVNCRLEKLGGLEEWRPVAYRFTGLKEDKQ